MARKSPDEDPLVDFLRQYRPRPPETPQDVESRLMNLIADESSTSCSSSKRLGGLIGGTICTGLLLFLGGFRWSHDNPQLAQESDRELESYLIYSWEETMGEPLDYQYSHPIESAWQMPKEPHLTYSTYQP